jgi:hypothetical protein
LYALIGEEGPGLPFDEKLREATKTYWSRFIDARHETITEARTMLSRFMNANIKNCYVSSALDSIAATEGQLDTIKPDLCVDFLKAWRADLSDWQKFSTGVNNVGSTRDAMNFLELKTWTLSEFGAAAADSETAPPELTTSVAV